MRLPTLFAIAILYAGLCAAQKSTVAPEPNATEDPDVEVTSTSTKVVVMTSTMEPKPTPNIPNNRTITVTNQCSFPVYPGVLTSDGEKPYTSGFLLDPGRQKKLWVSHDWSGRIWGRTNCTWGLDDEGKNVVGKCLTGDCGGVLECTGGTGEPPATLAEFSLLGHANLSYYDISLVDGYNLDMQIIPEHGPPSSQNTTSPKCVATKKEDARWCPWDNQYFLQEPKEDKIFAKPNDHKKRMAFNPCLSACARTRSDKDCCKNKYNDPKKCKPSLYSKKAKAVCGDAYSYAYDDLSSTFTVPSGEGFEIIFCPSGDSTNILKASAAFKMTVSRAAYVYVAILATAFFLM